MVIFAVVKYHVKRQRLEMRAICSINSASRVVQGAGMDRLFAGGTVNATEVGSGTPLFLFHSLLSDRASFDAVVPELSKSFRVIVPELPGFGRSQAVSGGLADIADRMAEAVKDAAGGQAPIVLGNGYGGFVA